MSANSHNFPEMFRASLDPQGMDIADCYDVGEVMYWFQRMMDDFPDSYMSIHFTENVEAWFDKWLSQFRNKCQK